MVGPGRVRTTGLAPLAVRRIRQAGSTELGRLLGERSVDVISEL
jgi:hypothetical protein